MDPVVVLPEEIWRKILVNYTAPKDKHSAYNTCKLWRNLLKENVSEWMFQEIFPLLFKYFKRDDILMARGICKSWKGTIDSYLENDQPYIAAPGCHYECSESAPFRTFVINFCNSARRFKTPPNEALQRFQSQFAPEQRPITKNPFVTRSLDLSINKLEMEILTFFQIFGRHLYSLKLAIWGPLTASEDEQVGFPLEIAMSIWNILSEVPNLRKLAFLSTYCRHFEPGEEMEKLQKQQLEEFFETNPVPPLPHLNNLQLFTFTHPLIRQTLEFAYAPQLKKYVHYMTPEPHNSPLHSNLRNLMEMVWNFYFGFPSHVDNLKSPECKSLQRLYIIYGEKPKRQREAQLENSNRDAELLFEAIESFKTSLTYLSLSWKHWEPIFPKQLDLPFLQELCLEVTSSLHSDSINLSFLVKLASLRKLKLVFRRDANFRAPFCDFPVASLRIWDKKKYVDKCFHMDGDIPKVPKISNFWRQIPSLDQIKIKIIRIYLEPVVVLRETYTRGNNGNENVTL